MLSVSLDQATEVASFATGVPAIVAAPTGLAPRTETATRKPVVLSSVTVAPDAVAPVSPACAASWAARSVASVASESAVVTMWDALNPLAVIVHVSPGRSAGGGPAGGGSVSVTVACVKSIGVVPSDCVAVAVRLTVPAELTSCMRPLTVWPLSEKPAGFAIERTTWPLPFVDAVAVKPVPSWFARPCATWSRLSPAAAV